MDRYRIIESVGRGTQAVHSYEDLEIHHPSANRKGVASGRLEDFENPRKRSYARVDGDFEEVRNERDGRVLVKKDFILTRENGGPVHVPSPVAGYVHYLHDRTAAVRVYDRPFGEPGARLLAQSLHMDPGSFRIPEGGRVAYGQPLGRMSDSGTPGSVHAHVEVEAEQFRRYIRDIDRGAIAPGRWPGRVPPAVAPHGDGPSSPVERVRAGSAPTGPGVDGVLEQGEDGIAVRRLQQRLNALGIRDAEGLPLVEDGDFGRRTREAVESFQRDHGLEADGRVGRDTRAALAKPHGTRITDTRHPDYPLFEQLLGKVQGAEAERGLASGTHSLSIAAALAVQVRQSGLERVDRVELNDTARLVRAVHSPTGRWEHELTTQPIDTARAAVYSIHAASDRLAELARARQHEAGEPQRNQLPAPAL